MEEKTQTPKRKPHSERKMEILRTLVTLISESQSKNITTKSLAARLGVSEAALYRHFSSKAKMYEEIIGFAEGYISSWINKITSEDPTGIGQAKTLFATLMSIEQAEPGLTSLLCGETLSSEDPMLQQKINRIYQIIEIAFKQSLRVAIAREELPEGYDAALRARMLTSLVLGQWLKFAKKAPSDANPDWLREAAVVIGR